MLEGSVFLIIFSRKLELDKIKKLSTQIPHFYRSWNANIVSYIYKHTRYISFENIFKYY